MRGMRGGIKRMADYKRRDLIEREVRRLSTNPFNEWDTMGILLLLDTIPNADVRENIHGEWLTDNICSVCGDYNEFQTNFCPNCGAKMDEVIDDG